MARIYEGFEGPRNLHRILDTIITDEFSLNALFFLGAIYNISNCLLFFHFSGYLDPITMYVAMDLVLSDFPVNLISVF